jgi:hypothetical protein
MEKTETLSISDIMSTKSRLLLLIVELSKKHGYIDADDLIDESLEIFSNDYKDEKVAKTRIKQMIEELNNEKKITMKYEKNKVLISPNVNLPHRIVIEKVYVKATMIFAIAILWLIWILSWLTLDVWMIFLSFAGAFLTTLAYFNYEKRFVLDLKETAKK